MTDLDAMVGKTLISPDGKPHTLTCVGYDTEHKPKRVILQPHARPHVEIVIEVSALQMWTVQP